ncbi:hypothetical protein D3C85_1162650 [compost metagenome]
MRAFAAGQPAVQELLGDAELLGEVVEHLADVVKHCVDVVLVVKVEVHRAVVFYGVQRVQLVLYNLLRVLVDHQNSLEGRRPWELVLVGQLLLRVHPPRFLLVRFELEEVIHGLPLCHSHLGQALDKSVVASVVRLKIDLRGNPPVADGPLEQRDVVDLLHLDGHADVQPVVQVGQFLVVDRLPFKLVGTFCSDCLHCPFLASCTEKRSASALLVWSF